MDRCPCKNCICLPVCRHKQITKLFVDCGTIADYETSHIHILETNGTRIYINKIQRALKPTKWMYSNEEDKLYDSDLVHFIESRKKEDL